MYFRFTPAREVELCGHATLAAAHTLLENGIVNSEKPIIFETVCSGELIATPLADGKIELTFPATPASAFAYSAEQLSWVKEAFGFQDEDVVFAGKTIYDAFFEVTPSAFANIKEVNYSLLTKYGGRGVLITTLGGLRTGNATHPQYDFLSRCFFPL